MNTNNSVKVGDYVRFLNGSEGLVVDGGSGCSESSYRTYAEDKV